LNVICSHIADVDKCTGDGQVAADNRCDQHFGFGFVLSGIGR
jgi:hypothetical protein